MTRGRKRLGVKVRSGHGLWILRGKVREFVVAWGHKVEELVDCWMGLMGWTMFWEVGYHEESVQVFVARRVTGWESEFCLIRKGLGKSDDTCCEDEEKEADAGGITVLETFTMGPWEGEICACELLKELCKREKGLIEKEQWVLGTEIIWEPGRHGGAEQAVWDWSAPCPTPSMVNFTTEKDNFGLWDIKENVSKLVRQAERGCDSSLYGTQFSMQDGVRWVVIWGNIDEFWSYQMRR